MAPLAAVAVVYPEGVAHPCGVWHQAVEVGHHASDAAAGARHDEPHVLAGHLRAVVEQIGLHRGSHLAPPERCDDDDVLIAVHRRGHGVYGGIAAGVAWCGLDGIQQLRAQGVAVGLVLQSLLCRLNLQHVGLELAGQCSHYVTAVVGVAVVCHQRLACAHRRLGVHLSGLVVAACHGHQAQHRQQQSCQCVVLN